MTPRRKMFALVAVAAPIAVCSVAGCAGLLSFDDYVLVPGDGASQVDVERDATGDALDETGQISCGVDLAATCYPCNAVTNEQLLNACSDGQCLPFDRRRLDGLLAPDGALPALPPSDGGGA